MIYLYGWGGTCVDWLCRAVYSVDDRGRIPSDQAFLRVALDAGRPRNWRDRDYSPMCALETRTTDLFIPFRKTPRLLI